MTTANTAELVSTCNTESAAAARFASAAIENAKAGRTAVAWKLADAARCAATCAMDAHDKLWEATEGNLTGAEWEAFNAAENARSDCNKAQKAAAESVAKANRR